MDYIEIELGGNTYKARLGLKAIENIENKIKKNPANVLLDCKEDSLPKITDMLVIIHESLQKLNHGIKYEDVEALVEKDLESGNKSIAELVIMVTDILMASGLIKNVEG